MTRPNIENEEQGVEELNSEELVEATIDRIEEARAHDKPSVVPFSFGGFRNNKYDIEDFKLDPYFTKVFSELPHFSQSDFPRPDKTYWALMDTQHKLLDRLGIGLLDEPIPLHSVIRPGGASFDSVHTVIPTSIPSVYFHELLIDYGSAGPGVTFFTVNLSEDRLKEIAKGSGGKNTSGGV